MSANLRQQRELALMADDTSDLTRLDRGKASLEFVSETDAVIAALRDVDRMGL